MTKLIKKMRTIFAPSLFASSFRSNLAKALFMLVLLSLNACTYLGLQTIPVETLEAEYQNEHSKYINIDGQRIHYRDEGEGPLLLLIHNELGSLHSWDVWVEELKDNYRIIRMDLPGFGLSEEPGPDQYGRSAAVEFIARFIEELNLKNINMVGSSYGGFTAWNYTLDNPDNVDRLILLAPVGYTQKLPMIVTLFAAPGVESITNFVTPKPMVASALKRGFGSEHRLNKQIISRYHDLLLRKGNRTSGSRFFKALKINSKNEYLGVGIKDISVPTLVMWGEQDKWTPIDYLSLWIEDVPGLQYISYPSVGHLIHEEIPRISAQDFDLYMQDRLEKFPGS